MTTTLYDRIGEFTFTADEFGLIEVCNADGYVVDTIQAQSGDLATAITGWQATR